MDLLDDLAQVTVTLVYDLKYERYYAVETITSFRADGADRFLILGHNISSDGLLLA